MRCEEGKDIASNSTERLRPCEIWFCFWAVGVPGHSFMTWSEKELTVLNTSKYDALSSHSPYIDGVPKIYCVRD